MWYVRLCNGKKYMVQMDGCLDNILDVKKKALDMVNQNGWRNMEPMLIKEGAGIVAEAHVLTGELMGKAVVTVAPTTPPKKRVQVECNAPDMVMQVHIAHKGLDRMTSHMVQELRDNVHGSYELLGSGNGHTDLRVAIDLDRTGDSVRDDIDEEVWRILEDCGYEVTNG